MKKLVIAGGTGDLGKALCKYLENDFDEIIVLSRGKHESKGKVQQVDWDGKSFGDWCKHIDDANVVINLCGKSVDCRYNEENKKLLFSSRLDPTSIIGKAIQHSKTPPALWINAASSTIYKHSEDEPMTESKGEIGDGFSVELCKAWEKVVNDCEVPSTRKVILRISMVLGDTGGVLPVLNKLVKFGLGGTIGKGTQQVGWIHIQDFCAMVDWLIKNNDASGPYNVVAPLPVTNKKLMQLLREKNNVKIGLPAAEWMLEIGAFFLRTETELMLKSRYAVPDKAMQQGFKFKYGEIENCLDNLIR